MTKLVVLVVATATVVALGGCAPNDGQGDDDTKVDTGVTPAVDSQVGSDSTVSSSLQPVYASGPRLKRRIITGSDGSKDFAGWYDSQLGVNCAWGVAEDGTKRCLPDAWDLSGYQAFSDANCTMPLAFIKDPAPACIPGTTAFQRIGWGSLDSCGPAPMGGVANGTVPAWRLVRFTAGVPYTGTVWSFSGATGSLCRTYTTPFAGTFYAATSVPAAMLVEAVETRE